MSESDPVRVRVEIRVRADQVRSIQDTYAEFGESYRAAAGDAGRTELEAAIEWLIDSTFGDRPARAAAAQDSGVIIPLDPWTPRPATVRSRFELRIPVDPWNRD